jgi:hypothetical protein
MKNGVLQPWIFILLAMMGAAVAHAQVQMPLVGTYVWRDSDRDGEPSACDCDYRLEVVQLNADSTFLYKKQRGRLDAKVELTKGTWTYFYPNSLQLHSTHVKGRLYPMLIADKDCPEEWRPSEESDWFTFDGFDLQSQGYTYHYSHGRP